MPLPARYGPPPVPPPVPGPMPEPSPSPRPVPCPVPAPPPVPDPWLAVLAGASARTPAWSLGSAAAVATGAITWGSGSGAVATGGGSIGRSTGRGRTGGVRATRASGRLTAGGRGGGTGLRSALTPFNSARFGGAGCRKPPPPPPPPGPGVARNTIRILERSGATSWDAVVTPSVVIARMPANIRPWSAPDAARARPGDVWAVAGGLKICRGPDGTRPRRNSWTARTARSWATNRPSRVRNAPDRMEASTSPRATPAARAISRALKTSEAWAVMVDMLGLPPGNRGKSLAAPLEPGWNAVPCFSAVLDATCWVRTHTT